MPDDYYVSQYSGEEIDALLGSAGAGTVRYDAAQTLTDEQKAQARGNIAAAPDGFGLGLQSVELTSSDNLDNVNGNGWYFWGSSTPANAPTLINANIDPAYCSMFMIRSSQIVVSINDRNNMAMRSKNVDGWTPWEYVNPPMQLGVEYRTTERYLGKPVYIKAVECGTIPINSTKAVSFDPSYDDVSTASTFRALCVWGITSDRWTLPALLYGYGLDRSINISGYFNGILIGTTETGSSNSTVTAVVKYIKTTD